MVTVDYDKNSFRINSKPLFIYSGEIHYFRVPRELWDDRLLKIRRAFLNSVSLYFAWNWHEQEEGRFDFSGWRDVERLLELCKKNDLYVIARPGPYICAEWDFGGFPNWLIGKDAVLRSADEEFTKYSLRYYDHLLPSIRRHLITRDGKVILFQIENEYFWGNVPYLLKWYEAARERGIDVPIVHNVDRYLRGTQVIDSIDFYPDPWSIEGPEAEAAGLAEEQPDKPKMVMEFEGGWFASFGGGLPTQRGDIPAEWTDMLLKSIIFKGINGINLYMIHGGTNFGYWTGKDLTSTYDYQASIREWGELGERYWVVRLIGALLESFNDQFTSSELDSSFAACKDSGLHITSRVNADGNFILVANRTDERKETSMSVRGLGEKKVKLGGKTALVLPCKVRLRNGWVLEFSTSQVFYSYDLEGRTILILYGKIGEEHEVSLLHPVTGKRETISFKVQEKDEFRLVRDEFADLLLVTLNEHRAARTWFLEHLGKKVAVVSGFDLLRDYASYDGGFRINIDFKKGDEREVNVITPHKPRTLWINREGIESDYDDQNGVLSFNLPDVRFEEMQLDLDSGWRSSQEDVAHIGQARGWLELDGLTSPESLGMTSNGHLWYVNKFSIDKTKGNLTLFVPRVNDYVSVFLNNRFIGFARGTVSFEVDEKLLQTGANEIVLLIESTGHRNDGILPVANGLNEPVYLGKEETLALQNPSFKLLKFEEFLKPGLPASFDYSRFVNRPTDVLPPEKYFLDGWKELRSEEDLKDQAGIFLFRYVARLPGGKKNAIAVLPSKLQGWGRVSIFVNKKHVRTVPNAEGGVGVDVTDLVRFGEENEFVFLVEGGVNLRAGMNPCIKFYDMALRDGWKISEGLFGEREHWFSPEVDDSRWQEKQVKDAVNEGKIVWLRRRFPYKPRDDTISPLMLRVTSLGTKCKIYLNCELIGRYMKIGPQRDFYLPEPFLKENNCIAIAVENYQEGQEDADAPSLKILPYYVAKKLTIELNL